MTTQIGCDRECADVPGLGESPEMLWRRLTSHHHSARDRFGCRIIPVLPFAPIRGLHSIGALLRSRRRAHGRFANVETAQQTAAVVYSHPDLPWRYFNHAIIHDWGSANPGALASTAAKEMIRAGRAPCFHIPLPDNLTGGPLDRQEDRRPLLLTGSDAWGESLLNWASYFQGVRYHVEDELLVMGRSLPVNSPGKLAAGYTFRRMEIMERGKQVTLHRSGFAIPESRSAEIDRLLVGVNLDAGVDYLWAIDVESQEPVGSSALLIMDNVAELFAVSVLPEHRHRGVGSSLVTAAMQHSAAAGCRLIYLQCEPGSRSGSLYGKLGFAPLWRQVCFIQA